MRKMAVQGQSFHRFHHLVYQIHQGTFCRFYTLKRLRRKCNEVSSGGRVQRLPLCVTFEGRTMHGFGSGISCARRKHTVRLICLRFAGRRTPPSANSRPNNSVSVSQGKLTMSGVAQLLRGGGAAPAHTPHGARAHARNEESFPRW